MSSFRLAAAALLVAAAPACFVDPGLQPPASTAAATSSTSTSTASTDTTPTTTAVTPTTGPVCSGAGEPCDSDCCGCLACDPDANTCIAVDTKCGPCQQCQDDGTCTIAPSGTACAHAGPGCAAFIWGPIGSSCHAFARADGICDGDGTCIAGLCLSPGLPIYTCASESCLDPGTCTLGRPVAELTLSALCSAGKTTATCGPTCDGDLAIASQCDAGGACVVESEQPCGAYACTNGQCPAACRDAADCVRGYVCSADLTCVPAP